MPIRGPGRRLTGARLIIMFVLLAARRTGAFVSNSHRLLLPAVSSQWRPGLLYSTAINAEELERRIKIKGDEIRQLKEDGIEKTDLAPHVEELKALKAQLPPTGESKEKRPLTKNKQPEKKQLKTKPEEVSESELRQARLNKVAAMREAGVEPFEYAYKPTHTAAELQDEYNGRLEGGEEDKSADVAVAGRIMVRRVFGKLAFFTLQDESGTIQLHLEKSRLGDSFTVRFIL
jgi:hypothetical protein